MVEGKEIKRIMSVSEFAICLEKRWIMRDSLVQQISRLQKIRQSTRDTAKNGLQKKIVGASVEIERGDVARRGAFDCVLFARRKFGLQLVGDRLGDLTLNGEHVREIAIISLPP